MMPAHYSAQPASSSSILVIEEHPFQRRALARKLNGLGVPRVLEASSGTDALELVRANGGSIVLILSDVERPQVDGLELLRRLATDAPRTAVAVLSAPQRQALKAIEATAAEYGLHLVGVLEKPVSDDALRAVLVRALSSSTRVRGRPARAEL